MSGVPSFSIRVPLGSSIFGIHSWQWFCLWESGVVRDSLLGIQSLSGILFWKSRFSPRRLPGHCKETQIEAVWTRLPFIRSGQNHLVRHCERGKKTTQTEEEVGRQHHGMDRSGVRQVPEGSGDRENGGNWLLNHLWCPKYPRDQGIDDDDDGDE